MNLVPMLLGYHIEREWKQKRDALLSKLADAENLNTCSLLWL